IYFFSFHSSITHPYLHSFPTRRSSDLIPPMPIRIYNTLTKNKETLEPVRPGKVGIYLCGPTVYKESHIGHMVGPVIFDTIKRYRSEEHTSELQSRRDLVCRLLLEKKKK